MCVLAAFDSYIVTLGETSALFLLERPSRIQLWQYSSRLLVAPSVAWWPMTMIGSWCCDQIGWQATWRIVNLLCLFFSGWSNWHETTWLGLVTLVSYSCLLRTITTSNECTWKMFSYIIVVDIFTNCVHNTGVEINLLFITFSIRLNEKNTCTETIKLNPFLTTRLIISRNSGLC
jgi:hypothetical protein